MTEWGSENSSLEQDKELRALASEVLGRELISSDLHAAYAHAGVSRPPALMPANLKEYQATRLIKWLEATQDMKRKALVKTGPDPCIYCAFGCDLCE